MNQSEKKDASMVKEDIDIEVAHAETAPATVGGTRDGFTNLDEGFDPLVVKRTLRKVDLRLLPILIAMYFVSQCDRSNLGQARAANNKAMNTDLKLLPKYGGPANKFGLITMMFFIPYIIFEIPSQIGLRRFGSRIWLGSATVAWGSITLGMGFAKTWDQLMGLRVILGLFEACLYPGATFLISCWYPRRYISTRLSMFYTIAQAFAGLSATMSYGISQLHGRRGLHGWQWIFIFYGWITILIGVISFFLLVNFPHSSHFLSEQEKYIVETRINRDRNDAVPDELTLQKCITYALDWKLWVFGFMFCTGAMGVYSMSFFLPQILQSIGFSNALAQLLMAPPYVYMLIPCIGTARISDTVRNMRGAMVIFSMCCTITGVMMFSKLDKSQKGARYFGVFLACGGINSTISLVNGWAQACIRAQSKRGFASALVIAWGGVGGILSAVAFYEADAPSYPTGIWLVFAMSLTTLLCAVVLALYFRHQNARADRGEVVLEGDPDFRYQW